MEFILLKLNLVLRRKSDNEMIFSPAPWFRFLFLFLAIVIIIGIITISTEEVSGSLIIPIIIGIICLAASLYEESWSFDIENQIVSSRIGLILLNRKSSYSFTDIENLQLSLFLRGAESDGSADHEINLTRPFSKENTEDASGKTTKTIHKRWHQEIRLNLKNGERLTVESLDSRGTEGLSKKAGLLSDFTGIPLVR